MIINDPTAPQTCRYNTFVNVNVRKLASGDTQKQMSCLTILISTNLNLLQLTFSLIFATVNIKMSSSGSNAGMETSAPRVNGIINNALFHSSAHINQTLPQITHILHFCPVDSLLNYGPVFKVNRIEVMDVRRPQIWRDECTAAGFTQLLRVASLRHFRPRSRCMIQTTEDCDRPVCLGI